eukprot:70154_1
MVHSECPYLREATPGDDTETVTVSETYNTAVKSLDIGAVFTDIYDLLEDSHDCWPADTFGSSSSYGPLFVRLTWHCSGSYRDTDQKGGCAGGRIRFNPEASWDDNTNLDKARALLYPIKKKYGDALSYGDLFAFAGTAAILHMGGPVSEICAGRVDSEDGTLSKPLGPSDEAPPCTEQGNCEKPLGADTIGLIYVNPEGVLGDPVPEKSAVRIREVFGRMGMNDTETVALIGGGHAFGKCHGACDIAPSGAPFWEGKCGTGYGEDTFTSGFEGQWTTNPLKWDNEYFVFLRDGQYNLTTGDGGKYQWENQENGFIMLTADLALVNDDKYEEIVNEFADDIEKLNDAFSKAWAKLTTQGGVMATNKFCIDVSELVYPTTTDDESIGCIVYIGWNMILLAMMQFLM